MVSHIIEFDSTSLTTLTPIPIKTVSRLLIDSNTNDGENQQSFQFNTTRNHE